MNTDSDKKESHAAFNSFTKSERQQLNNEIRANIKQGYDREQIIANIQSKFEFAKDAEPTVLVKYITTEVEQFQGFDFIQRVKSSIILSPNNSNTLYLYSPLSKTKEIVLETQLHKLVKFDWASKILPCKFEYHPYTSEDIFQTDDGTSIFNTYVPPNWKKPYHYKIEKPVAAADLPDVYDKFFTHLFKNDVASKNYVLDWIATGIKSKNQCYLATIGKAGTGKGTLGDIIKLLTGNTNYTHVAFKSIKKQFNALLKDKQFIYFDEVLVSNPDEDALLKMLVNDTIEVELKNIDSQTIKNHASVYLSSNHLHSLKMTDDDRRYSITELTDIPFREAFDNKFREELLAPDNIQLLGRHLLTRVVDQNKMRNPFKSSRTLLAKQSSLKEWEDYLLYTVAYELAGQSVPLSTVDSQTKDATNSTNFRVTAKSLEKLSEAFPGFYTVKRVLTNNRKLFMVTFKSLEEQPREKLENIEVTDAN